MTYSLHLDDAPVSLSALVAAARGPVSITLSDALRDRLVRARAVVDRHAAGDAPVYGLNTGLGANLGHRIAGDEMAAFQVQLLEGRRAGVGPPLPERVCRTALLARIVGTARGGSGLSPAVFDALCAMAARGLAPAIPSRGSIGAGDLVLGASIGSALLGTSPIWVDGMVVAGERALAGAGLAPVTLAPKDAMALANHSAVTVALAGCAAEDARRWLTRAMAVAALSAEAYAANLSIFEEPIHAARPAAGQVEAAAWFRRAFAGSSLHDATPRAIQDALSFRTMAPVLGAARATLDLLIRELEVELNAAADNPLVLLEDGRMPSTPNFHTPSIAIAADALRIAFVQVAAAAAQRIVKHMTPELSALPRYLSPVGGASAGMVPMQKTAAALLAEIRQRAQPAALDAMAVSDRVEDVAPLSPLAAMLLSEQLEAFEYLVAVEAVVAAQAIDLRAPTSMGTAASAVHRAIRGRVAPLHADRATGPDVDAARAALDDDEVLDQTIARIDATS